MLSGATDYGIQPGAYLQATSPFGHRVVSGEGAKVDYLRFEQNRFFLCKSIEKRPVFTEPNPLEVTSFSLRTIHPENPGRLLQFEIWVGSPVLDNLERVTNEMAILAIAATGLT